MDRFGRGSLGDPFRRTPNWNRSFEMPVEEPRGGILPLHGLSDSPYSCRARAELLRRQGFWVVDLRVPGHGTYGDVSAREGPFYMGGYSNGAALAVEYSLAVMEGEDLPAADTLLLLSPAIGVTPVAALAIWQARLGDLAGVDKLAWNTIQPAYGPYKYNSFAVNAGDQMYELTQQIYTRIGRLDQSGSVKGFPRVLAFQLVVDATGTRKPSLSSWRSPNT